MALFSPFFTPSVRLHCPMHGPQALARTIPPASSNVASVWSRSRVARICSLPGVMKKSATGARPAAEACLTKDSQRVMSAYEEFVQEPIRPAPKVSGHWFAFTVSLKAERGVLRSGVKGPLMCGSSSERLISTTSSYWQSGSAARRFRAAGREAMAEASSAIEDLWVDCR